MGMVGTIFVDVLRSHNTAACGDHRRQPLDDDNNWKVKPNGTNKFTSTTSSDAMGRYQAWKTDKVNSLSGNLLYYKIY